MNIMFLLLFHFIHTSLFFFFLIAIIIFVVVLPIDAGLSGNSSNMSAFFPDISPSGINYLL